MKYLNILLKSNQQLFHTSDLALLWGISNENTLYTTIKRFVKKGVLLTIHKGFYSTVPLKRLNPVLLGIRYLNKYAYLSCESVLSQAGIINQYSKTVTLISDRSRKFEIADHKYIVRKMTPRLLFNDAGIKKTVNGYKIASVERAAVDMLHFNPKFHFDGFNLIDKKAFFELKDKLNGPLAK